MPDSGHILPHPVYAFYDNPVPLKGLGEVHGIQFSTVPADDAVEAAFNRYVYDLTNELNRPGSAAAWTIDRIDGAARVDQHPPR